MRTREKILNGFIANLTDAVLTLRIGDTVTTDFLPSGDYGSDYHSHFDGKFDDAGEVYGKLNGCFTIYYPKNGITTAEEAEVSKVSCQEPKVSKANRDRQFFIVPREVAIKAVLENWKCLSKLLIPADPLRREDKDAGGDGKTIENTAVGQGFILASLLRPETNH